MSTVTRTIWRVAFAHYYATITTNVPATDADEAIDTADKLIRDTYGIDLTWWMVADAEDSTFPAE